MSGQYPGQFGPPPGGAPTGGIPGTGPQAYAPTMAVPPQGPGRQPGPYGVLGRVLVVLAPLLSFGLLGMVPSLLLAVRRRRAYDILGAVVYAGLFLTFFICMGIAGSYPKGDAPLADAIGTTMMVLLWFTPPVHFLLLDRQVVWSSGRPARKPAQSGSYAPPGGGRPGPAVPAGPAVPPAVRDRRPLPAGRPAVPGRRLPPVGHLPSARARHGKRSRRPRTHRPRTHRPRSRRPRHLRRAARTRRTAAPAGPRGPPVTFARVIGGRYHLTEKIGHGGMGQVWAGRDERLARPVAVKLLRTDHLLAATGAGPATAAHLGPGDELRHRFLRECRTTAALDHPGLVTVFDAGEDGGELYLVMQRVPGVSLADLIAEDAPFPIERAVSVAAQLCAALAAVHAVPVVHRDLKPSNVMVREDGRTVLLDLGIATAIDPAATRLTLTGVPIGSPTYMAPEQALSAAVDPRSDLYALGCLLHEMLTGEGPFRAPTALGLLRRHVDDPPVPLRDLRPEVPAPLERLVLDLLAKRPQDRPADAQEVYGRLLPLLPAAVPVPQPRFGPLPDPARPYRHPLQPQPRPAG
ncbi:serine/threonine-protein kinase, partial [Kitasatospora putterlickiae]|uniref:serine/threonine-protein kinase n=1 Tax=Kitasatospora putterlickiae TaxID=221725 RepID=UPI003CD08A7D